MDPYFRVFLIAVIVIAVVAFLSKIEWKAPLDRNTKLKLPGFRIVGNVGPEDLRRARLWEALTLRERFVVKLALERKSNEEIAEEMSVSRRTVEKHLENIYRKLEIHSRFELYSAMPKFDQPPDVAPDDDANTT